MVTKQEYFTTEEIVPSHACHHNKVGGYICWLPYIHTGCAAGLDYVSASENDLLSFTVL